MEKTSWILSLTMQISLKLDTISPSLKRVLKQVENPSAVLREIGTTVVEMSKKAFTNPSLRPSTWKANAASTIAQKGASSPLVASGTMARSPRVTDVGRDYVRVGSDRSAGSHSLAAIHQLGTGPFVIRPKSGKFLFWKGAKHPVKQVNHPGIPARPFFPFHASGEATETAKRRVKDVILAWLKK